jgi:hypothetical protein
MDKAILEGMMDGEESYHAARRSAERSTAEKQISLWSVCF